MQNELIKHGFSRKKMGKSVIFEKEEALYDYEIGGVIDRKHVVIKKGKRFYLNEANEQNAIVSYPSFLDRMGYPDMSEHGFVYLIMHNDVYKIGMTKDLLTRIRFFKNTLPGKVVLVGYIVSLSYKKVEKSLHIVFEKKIHSQFDNEWFDLDEEDLLFFNKVKAVVEN